MNNKEYLRRAYDINRRLKARRIRLAYLKSLVGTMNHEMSDIPRSSPLFTSQMEELAIRIVDLESAIAKDEEDLQRARKEISESIRALGNENYASILQMRYLDYMDWMDIMRSMDYCRSYLYKLHGRAIQMVRQKT